MSKFAIFGRGLGAIFATMIIVPLILALVIGAMVGLSIVFENSTPPYSNVTGVEDGGLSIGRVIFMALGTTGFCALLLAIVVEWPKALWFVTKRVSLWRHFAVSVIGGSVLLGLPGFMGMIEHSDKGSFEYFGYHLIFAIPLGAYGGLCSAFAWWMFVFKPMRAAQLAEQGANNA